MDIDSEVGEGFNDFDVVTGNWHKGAWEEGSLMDGILITQLFKFGASRHQQDRGILLETGVKAKAPRFEAEDEA